MSTTAPPREVAGAAAAAGTARRRRRRSGPVGAPAIWFAAPAMAIYAFIVLYPSLAGAFYAFTDWTGIGSFKWIGLQNFKSLFSDKQSLGSPMEPHPLTVLPLV